MKEGSAIGLKFQPGELHIRSVCPYLALQEKDDNFFYKFNSGCQIGLLEAKQLEFGFFFSCLASEKPFDHLATFWPLFSRTNFTVANVNKHFVYILSGYICKI